MIHMNTNNGPNRVMLPNAASFLISEDCNLACTYCFELGGRRSIHMSKEVARKGVEFLAYNAVANRDSNFNVTFFGGEPLLKPDIVEEVFRYGVELAEKLDLQFSSSMITNATLLDDNIERIIRTYRDKANFSLQLSVDGIKEVHDKYRITRGGGGSFDVIESNIPRWKALFEDAPGRLCIHGCSNAETLPYLYENFLFFRETWGIPRIWFMPIHSEEWSNEDLKIYDKQLGKIADYVLEDMKKTGNMEEVWNYSPIDSCMNPDSFPSAPCGAGKNFITITAKGDLFPCHQIYFNDPEHITKIGTLETGIDEMKRSLFADYGNEDLSCSKLKPECSAYACYRCIGENWGQNGSILSTVDCLGVRCKMSQIERKFQLKVRKEIEDMGLLNHGSREHQCESGQNGQCDCQNRTAGGSQYSNQNEQDENVIASALILLLQKVEGIEKEQASILEKLL